MLLTSAVLELALVIFTDLPEMCQQCFMHFTLLRWKNSSYHGTKESLSVIAKMMLVNAVTLTDAFYNVVCVP